MTLTIVDFLKANGISAFLQSTHVGDCVASYVVVRQAEAQVFLEYSSVQTFYDILCYVPKQQLSQLESYFATVKAEMKKLTELYMLRNTYQETATFYDDVVKAHMRSIRFVMYNRK